MPNKHELPSVFLRLAALVILLLAAGCSSDSPTAPQQTPTPPPDDGGGGSTTWSITVTASPSQLSVGSSSPAAVTIRVRRAADNQPPVNGTTVVVSTSMGDFDAQSSGVSSGPVALTNGEVQILLYAGAVEGSALVQAQLESSVGRTNVAFVGTATFYLDRIEPTTGDPDGGETVSIFGGGFIEPVRVSFGGQGAEVLNVSSDRVRVRTPPRSVPVGATQSVTVALTNDLNGDSQATDSLVNAYTYARGGSTDQPQILSVTPNSGPNEGGTRVTITGSGFEAPIQVLFGQGVSPLSFNGVEAQVESVTPTRIVVLSPPATGFGQSNLDSTVDILVRNESNGLATLALGAFDYGVQVLITAIAPGEGPYFGGDLVTLFGQGFDEPVAAGLADIGQQIVSVTGTEVVVRTVAITTDTCDDVSGPSSITNIETGSGATGPDYTYLVRLFSPTIGSLNPSSGTSDGGTPVTISGNNFRAPMQVTFNDRPGSVTVNSPTSMTVTTPFFPESDLDVEACDDNGDGAEGERYAPTAVDVVVTNLATTCDAQFPDGFLYTPADTTCRNDLGAPPVASFTLTTNGLQVTVVDTSSGNPSSWSWDFGDGTTATGPNAQHTYATGGTYIVSLTVTNNAGSDTATRTVTLSSSPVPRANFTVTTSGLLVSLIDTSSGNPSSWSWDFGDGATATTQNAQHTYSTGGTYIITLTVSNASGSDSLSQTVSVSGPSPPSANFTVTTNNLQVTVLDTSSGNPTSWSWAFGDGGTATGPNAQHLYAAAGTYIITLTATNATGSDSTSKAVTVSEPAP